MPEIEPADGDRSQGPTDASRVELPEVRGFFGRARQTEEAWRLLMESIKDFAIILLGTDGCIASWNEGASRLLGYADPEIIGKPLAHIFIPEDVLRDLPATELRQAAQKGRSGDDNWLLRRDGTRFWASGVTTPLRDRQGNLVGFAKVVRDLTEQKLAGEALKKANESLEERVAARTLELQLRIRELEGFASSVAHDLRAPLRAIHRYAELVLKEYRLRPLDLEGEESLDRIVEAAERMDSLIGHLLAYSRLADARLNLRAVALLDVIGAARNDLAAEFQERGASLQIEDPLPQVLGDSEMLGQAVFNLMSNAVKFVPEGVTPHVRIRAEPHDASIRLWVEDNGVGIAPEYHERIFLPFERLHQSDEYPGTGIGLAITKKAAERMGGAVGVDSRPGHGSRFWLDLPALPS